jgi:biopolymer transport protein TolR
MDMGTPGRKAKSDINVTPLIDIVLVLLIVFIVMVPSLTKALPISVPKVTTTQTPPKPDPLNPPVVISVLPSASGGGYEYLLQSSPVKLPEISEKLTPVLLRQVPGLRKVFLKVDGELPYQAAVDVMDQIRLASDQAKRETLAKSHVDGGDTKVVISLKKVSNS